MATLIQLKQIESASALITAAALGTNFSQSVATAVADSLPSGLVSSSAQIYITGTIGYNQFTSSFVTKSSFHSYTASLGNTFATDEELYLTASSLNMDAGEF
jgi:hypothetical protein